MTGGISALELTRLLRISREWVFAHRSAELVSRRPFYGQRKVAKRRVIRLLTQHLAMPGSAAIVGIEWTLPHWTVATGLSRKRIRLFDSGYGVFLTLKGVSFRGAGRANGVKPGRHIPAPAITQAQRTSATAMSTSTISIRRTHTPQRRPVALRDLSNEAATDQELLANLLAYSQGDVSAEPLLQRFHSLGHVLSAEPAQLAEFGIEASDVMLLRLVRDIACRLLLGAVRSRPTLGNWQALLDYCQATMSYEQIEQFRILFLDRKNHLIADEVQQRGTVDHTPVYPREVVKRALLLNASAVILVHNHPSGDPAPSRNDIDMTHKLKEALEVLEIALYDHLVIGHGSHTSFRTLGLL